MEEKVLEQLKNIPCDRENPQQNLSAILYQIAEEKKIEDKEKARLNKELATVEKLGLAPLFLFAYAATQAGVVVKTKGGEGNAYLNYLLGLSCVNPALCDLPFERFFHEDRLSLPTYEFFVEKGGKGLLLKGLQDRFGSNCFLRASDDKDAYFCAVSGTSELLKWKRIVVEPYVPAYEERVSLFKKDLLYRLPLYPFRIVEVEKVEAEPMPIEHSKVYEYWRRHRQEKGWVAVDVSYLHDLKEIAKDTDERVIFQDQLLLLLAKVGAMSLGWADYFRGKLVKGDLTKTAHLKARLEDNYEKSGVRLWEDIVQKARFLADRATVAAEAGNILY